MTSGVSWQEGVEPQTRESALEAARRSGQSVGEWLDTIISRRAANQAARAEAPSRASAGDDLDAIRGRLDDVGRRLDQFTRLNSSQPFVRADPPREEPSRDIAGVMSMLDRRLNPSVASGHSSDHESERRAGMASRDSEQGVTAADQEPAAAPEEPQPANPLEQALMEIAERQRALDADGGAPAERSPRADLLPRAPTQGLSGLELQLRDITSRFESLRPCGIDSAVEILRNDLAEIGLMLKEAMPRQAIEALESEVRGLSERLQHNRQGNAAEAAIAGVERGLAEIRDALRALTPAEGLVGVDEAVRALSQKIDLIASDTQDTAALAQLEGAIGALRGVVTHVASDGALAKLSDDVRVLAGKVDQIASSADSGTGLLATLEQRIAAIADALETRNGSGASVRLDVDSVVQGLAEKLERVGFGRSDQVAVGDLEDRIAGLIEKLDASNARLSQIETIERGLADLLDQQRLPRADVPPPELSELRRDMQQTQNSLQTVQGALTHVVDRLGMIEADVRGGIVPSAATHPMPSLTDASGSSRVAAAPASTSTTIRERPASAASSLPQVPQAGSSNDGKPASPGSHERRPIDPTLPPDHPLEPGAVRSRNSGSPVERIAASEAALGPVKPPVAPDAGSTSNFIAAARRAAQTASTEAAARSNKRTRAPVAQLESNGKTAGALGDRVRKVLVAVSVVVIVLGSLHFVVGLFSSPDEPAADGSQIQPQEQGDAPPVAPEAASPNGSGADNDIAPPASGPTMPPAPAPGRQSLLLPMGDGTSIAFSGAGNAAQTVQRPPATGPGDGASAPVISAQTPARAASERGTTGSIAPPTTIAPLVAAPELASLTTSHGARAPGTLPAAIGAPLRTAAAKGDPAAEYEIGQRYAEGRGIPQNMAEAADWFDRAAKQGLAPAQFRLGSFYEKGLGVKKDLDAARQLYQAAADAGNAKAMHNLAVLYAEGIDGKPDYPTAAKWFRKAADYGLADSQYNLGILYARGIGIEANLVEAYKWFALAARDGDRESVLKRDDVGGRLDPASLAAAKLAAQNFVPQQQPEAATQPTTPAGGWDAVATAVPAAAKSHGTAPRLDLSLPQASR